LWQKREQNNGCKIEKYALCLQFIKKQRFMKMTKFLSLLICLAIAACNTTTDEHKQSIVTAMNTSTDGYSKPISMDTANRMIGSYLNGINYTVNTNETRSLIYDADVLRDYLNSNPGKSIQQVKFMLAHTQEYTYSTNEGKRPDSNSNALTMIIVGVSANGDYLFMNGNQVMDFCLLCPANCLNTGTAASDILLNTN